MSKLTITRGLPGSGKTTYALAWVQAEPSTRRRVNRDSFRKMFHGDAQNTTQDTEHLITKLAKDAVRDFLRRGLDVIVDDTNLRQRTAREWATLAQLMGAEFHVIDLTDVPLDVCLNRNTLRLQGQGRVPEDAINKMYDRYLRGGRKLTEPVPLDQTGDTSGKYEPVTHMAGWPRVVICDLDGTVAKCGDRDIYDGSKAHLDTVHLDVWNAVLGFADHHAVDEVIFMTGRSDEHRAVTEQWIETKLGEHDFQLHMRAAGDTRKDCDVKYSLFNKHIRPKYNAVAAFDDRDQVVRLWRDMGIRCFQVADGNF